MTIYKAFWARIDKKGFYIALIPLVIILVVEIATTSAIPYTRKLVIDGLMDMNWTNFLIATVVTLLNSVVLIGAQGMKEWVGQKVALLSREALMKTIKKTWINKGGVSGVSNQCARLNDDTHCATEAAIKVGCETLISLCIVVALLVSILKWPMLFIAAVVYSAVSIGLAILFRAPMMERKYNLSNAEGQHRVSLTKISMQQGDFTSKVRWLELREAYLKYIAVCRNYKLFNALQTAVMFTLPFWIMAPGYFAGQVTLGEVIQGTSTFDLLVLNSTIWVQLYPVITGVQTAFQRVKEFYDDIH